MASDPSKFHITRMQLRKLMEYRSEDGKNVVARLGGYKGICYFVNTSPVKGLTESHDLKARKNEFGENVIQPKKPKTFWHFVWDAMKDTTLIVLQVCAVVSILLSVMKPSDGDNDQEKRYGWIEGVGILVSVIVVVLVTALNNLSKEKQFQGLQRQIEGDQKFSVIRSGTVKEILLTDIVVGDICLIKYGDAIPADGILIQSSDLCVDESTLTGESDHVKKGIDVDPMILSGTNVMEGSGKIVVTAVGPNSQSGIIMELLNSAKSKKEEDNVTVLQVKLTRLALLIGYVGSFISVLVVIIMTLQYTIVSFYIYHQQISWNHAYEYVKIFIVGITVLVVAVPEGLPLAVTLSLAYSVRKMMKDNNLVRHLHACETMGNATTICSDKTGTLTTNRMTVTQSYLGEVLRRYVPSYSDIPGAVAHKLAQGISVNTAYTSIIGPAQAAGGLPSQTGNKTECALLGFVQALGQNYNEIRNNHPQDRFVRVYTFNSARKCMSTVIRSPKGFRLYTKGASEVVLEKCAYFYGNNSRLIKLTDQMKKRIERKVIDFMSSNSLRTVTLAYRDFVQSPEVAPNETSITGDIDWDGEDWIVSNLTGLAIVGIEDPVRPEVPKSIAMCQRAGITVRMITGDNINTARSIALQCGIIKPGDASLVIESKEFNSRIRDGEGNVRQELLDELWPHLRVLARSTPADKYTLVEGIIESKIHAGREVVAVTGDGTNDAPALKKADIGFAMGIAGTDVAKQASDIILTDDNFSSIVSAVMWGRNVYDCIAKFLQFQLTVNVVAVTLAFFGACAVQTSPLRAVQMLWVNLVMDTLASLALATELPTIKLLDRKPYGRTRSLVSNIMMRNIIGQSVYQLVVVFLLLFVGDRFLRIESGQFARAPTEHYTVIFNTFVMMTLFNEIACRKVNGERNIFDGIHRNWLFLLIWMTTFIVQVLIIEYGSFVFWTKKLSWHLWLWCMGFGLGTLLWQQLVLSIPIQEETTVTYWELENLEKEAKSLVRDYYPEIDEPYSGNVFWLQQPLGTDGEWMFPRIRRPTNEQYTNIASHVQNEFRRIEPFTSFY